MIASPCQASPAPCEMRLSALNAHIVACPVPNKCLQQFLDVRPLAFGEVLIRQPVAHTQMNYLFSNRAMSRVSVQFAMGDNKG